MTRPFESLSQEEVLALAVHIERANARRLRAFADIFRGYDSQVATRFEELAVEEDGHEELLVDRFRELFGDQMPDVKEEDVGGVIESMDLDDPEHLIFDSMKEARVYELTLQAELNAQAFYRRAADSAKNAELAKLYGELAEMEDDHVNWVEAKLREARATRGES